MATVAANLHRSCRTAKGSTTTTTTTPKTISISFFFWGGGDAGAFVTTGRCVPREPSGRNRLTWTTTTTTTRRRRRTAAATAATVATATRCGGSATRRPRPRRRPADRAPEGVAPAAPWGRAWARGASGRRAARAAPAGAPCTPGRWRCRRPRPVHIRWPAAVAACRRCSRPSLRPSCSSAPRSTAPRTRATARPRTPAPKQKTNAESVPSSSRWHGACRAKFYWVLLGFTGFHWVILGIFPIFVDFRGFFLN